MDGHIIPLRERRLRFGAAGELSERLERQSNAIREAFPSYALQTVLTTAKSAQASAPSSKLFTHFFNSTELFFVE